VHYTDLNDDAVRHLNDNWLDYIDGVPREDAAVGTSYLTTAHPLHRPMGILIDAAGHCSSPTPVIGALCRSAGCRERAVS
jgi:hypothetical protein